AVLCRFGLGNANGQGKAPGDWRTPKASPPRLRFGVRQSPAALATILIWPLSRLLPQPLQFSLQLFKNPLGTGRFDEILHLVPIGLYIVEFIHALQISVLDVLPMASAHRLPARNASGLFLLEILGQERFAPRRFRVFEQREQRTALNGLGHSRS